MGRKKGKGKIQSQRDGEDEEPAGLPEGTIEAAEENPVISNPPGGRKKGKRNKKEFSDDLDADMSALASELGCEDVTHLDHQTAIKSCPEEMSKLILEPSESDKPAGKKARGDNGAGNPVPDIKGTGSNSTNLKSCSLKSDITPDHNVSVIDQHIEETRTLLTPAQKKAAKKERQKEEQRRNRLAQTKKNVEGKDVKTEDNSTIIDKAEGDDTARGDNIPDTMAAGFGTTTSNDEMLGAELERQGTSETMEGDTMAHGEDTEDKKKKKKKKKKTAEDEKKSKGPGKSAISKIKKMQAAIEEDKRRREQEALEAIRMEQEMEVQRLEKLQLEQERKERQKEKEKERKQRRRLEGKPVTKKEREAEARRQAHLAALKEQGIVLPEKTASEENKKKVLYGARQRGGKKDKQGRPSEVAFAEDAQLGEVEHTTNEPKKEDGKESWEDESEDENVKDNWDEDSDNSETTCSEIVQEKSDGVVDVGMKSNNMKADSLEVISSSGESSDEDSSDSDEDMDNEHNLSPFERAKLRIQKRHERYESERSYETLRSPVVCVLGHVDTGKTKILDKIRRTHVQDGEAGGITQQIGATFVPVEAISEQTKMVKEFSKTEIKLPGLLIIDTPGHESFSNLRSRGSSLCDIAILVVDIMHGLEAQTLESLNLLRKGGTPFIVALNKIDRLFDWHRNPQAGVKDTLKRQKVNTKDEFDERVKQVSTEFAEQGLNVALFWDKVDFREYIPLVPTSAITGDGMGDLIALLVNYSQKMLSEQLRLSMELEAIVLEVKVIAGLGTTVDVILRNGILNEGDTVVLTGTEGPFVTTIRALLMPQPLRELRVKNAYVKHSAVIAAQGVKIIAKGDLDKTLAGTKLLVARKPDELDVLKDEASRAMKTTLSAIKVQERGVYVQASTLGSLEALLEFLKQSKIPYCGVNIGPVHKKDVMKASVMLEHDHQWAVILAFDVRIEREAQEMADNIGVRVFSADIIYHLFDSFLKHREELREKNRRQFESVAVFPCKLRVLPNCIFNTRDPIVVGVVVEAGIIKPGTPLTVPSKNFTDIGVVGSLEVNHKQVESVRQGTEVCVKIEAIGSEAPRLYGRHFDYTDVIVSKISRESIDAVKNYFREDLQKSDWQLMIELKKMLQIM